MAGNLVPRTDGATSLGTADKEYSAIYAKNIGGTLADILAKKDSPALTGTPTAPTAAAGTATTQIATTAFADTAITTHNADSTAHSTQFAKYLPLSGGTISGSITVESAGNQLVVKNTSDDGKLLFAYGSSGYRGLYDTKLDKWVAAVNSDGSFFTATSPATADNSTNIATTAFVNNRLGSWTLGTSIESTSSTTTSYTIPSTAKEVMVEYGIKNTTQSFGGGVHISATNMSSPCLYPVYDSSVLRTIAYIFVNKFTVNVYNQNAANTLLFKIWYR